MRYIRGGTSVNRGLRFRAGVRAMDERTNFVVGWGTLALINAGLAQGKGRSGLVWCLLSFLLGPIATFLIVVLRRPPVEPD